MFQTLAGDSLKIRMEACNVKYPPGILFAFAEEAARGLAESDIRALEYGGACESVAAICSSKLMSAANSGDYDELARVTVRLYTEDTTLYRDLNRAIREFDDNAEPFVCELEPDLGIGTAASFRYGVPEDLGSLACYYLLLQQVLLAWPKSDPADVFRGVEMDVDTIEEYAEHVGDVVRWGGLISTSLLRRVAERFGNVLFVIHAAACTCIADAAAHRREREVLFLPGSCFVILRVTRDSRGRAEIELRDVYADPDFPRGLTAAEAREVALRKLRLDFGRERAELVIDQAEGIGLINRLLGNSPQRTTREIEVAASKFRAASAAYRADPGPDCEIRARQRAEALRRLREDPRALCHAASAPTPNEMRRVIAAGAALDARDEGGRTAAMVAAVAGSWRVLGLLIDADAEVAVSRDPNGRTALHYAAYRGHVRAAGVLLEAGVDLDARDSEGLTALAIGINANKPAVVELLICAGAALDAGYLEGGAWWFAEGMADIVGSFCALAPTRHGRAAVTRFRR
jgi:hypothetical protein